MSFLLHTLCGVREWITNTQFMHLEERSTLYSMPDIVFLVGVTTIQRTEEALACLDLVCN